jgi:hypothetical protein
MVLGDDMIASGAGAGTSPTYEETRQDPSDATSHRRGSSG